MVHKNQILKFGSDIKAHTLHPNDKIVRVLIEKTISAQKAILALKNKSIKNLLMPIQTL